jgi:hypothetical protein
MFPFRCQQDRKCNIEARSWCHCCSGKAKNITYYECVFVALVIQHAMPMRPHMSPARLYNTYFSTLSNKRHNFLKKMNIKCMFRFCLQSFSETSVITRRIERDIITNIYIFSCEVPAILVRL